MDARPYPRQRTRRRRVPTLRGGGDVIASQPFAVRRLFVDEEDAVAVIDERGAVGVEERLEPGVILGGRRRLRFRRRSVGLIGLGVHDVKGVGPAGFEPASGGL